MGTGSDLLTQIFRNQSKKVPITLRQYKTINFFITGPTKVNGIGCCLIIL